MAEALAGWLVCPVLKIVVDKARSCASDRIKWLSGGERDELLRLESLLVQIRTVAGAVERRSSAEANTDAGKWLQQLKDVVHDADDVLDDFDGQAPPPDSSLVKAGKRILGTDEALNRLKDVVKRLEAVHAGSSTLLAAVNTIAPAPALASGEQSGRHHLQGRATGSMRDDKDVVLGRDQELRKMVSWLTDGDTKSVPVAAIMGQGGIGKTTLAQLLIKDEAVASAFDLVIWVQPAATDGELELARQILQSADIPIADDMKNFDWLQKKIQEAVSSRTFLLVIDDVWNREDMTKYCYEQMWSKVLAPLRHEKTMGGKIVVTTRQRIVAGLLNATKEVWLDGLPSSEIQLLFSRCAFGDEDVSKQPTELRDIGRKIAEKLKGSPMAAKVVGKMLERSRSVTYWREVHDMDCFDSVSSTLQLCYQNLPEHLQPCFAICSLFPKNWKFKRERLVKIWMALDFIETTDGKTQPEDVGSKYFDQLVARSFFHKQKVGGRRMYYYYIHDLMHDLADKVSRFDCLRVESVKKEIPPTVRHLSVFSDAMEQLKSRCELRRLRTLLILENSSKLNQLQGDLFTELKGLRMLGLEGCDVGHLSEKVLHLKHLRYLALSKSITSLPKAVTKLYRLQTLRSPKGSSLEVPRDIINLKCLRHLDVDTSKVAGIGKLVHLQGSIEFPVKKEKGHTLEDLNGMSALRKELHIKNLEVVTGQQEACQAGLNKKENVKVLELEWNSNELEWNSTGKSRPSVDAEVLDGLEPHQYVKKLYIRRYRGNRSPNWLKPSLRETEFYLKYLYLINCRKWEILPALGQLPCLKVLHLKEMLSVKEIGLEFYGTNSSAFPCLEELEFDDMPQWVEWTQEENIDAFPKLYKLKLLNCPELIKVPRLPLSVKKVSVKNTRFVSQLTLSPISSKSCKFVLDTCSVTVLRDGLLCRQQMEAIASLTLRKCEDAKLEELQVFTSLKKLQIHDSKINNEQLGSFLVGLRALTYLEIFNCSNITSLPHSESPDCLIELHELRIQECSEFSSLRSLPGFSALESILIENCSKITAESFATSFNSNSSLKKLSIMNCAQLESLPSSFPSSLQVLNLIGCKPTLMNQLRHKTGPEWDKVACIPLKQIR